MTPDDPDSKRLSRPLGGGPTADRIRPSRATRRGQMVTPIFATLAA